MGDSNGGDIFVFTGGVCGGCGGEYCRAEIVMVVISLCYGWCLWWLWWYHGEYCRAEIVMVVISLCYEWCLWRLWW